MSSIRLTKLLGKTPVDKTPQHSRLSVTLELTEPVAKALVLYPDVHCYQNDSRLGLDDFNRHFDAINSHLSDLKIQDKKRVVLEEYKLALMLSLKKFLLTLNIRAILRKAVTKKRPSGFLHWLKVGFFALITVIGLADNGTSIFLGVRLMLETFFPSISLPVSLAISAIITALNAIQFVAWEVGILSKMLGVSSTSIAKRIVNAHDEQIVATKSINLSLSEVETVACLTRRDFIDLKNIAVKCNQDCVSKKSIYKEYHESRFKKGVRYVFTAFGALMVAAGSYFGATMLLTTVAASLLGTPVGWIIIGALMLSALVFYLAMQGKGMRDMFNPGLKNFNKVKESLAETTFKNEHDFDQTLLNKARFKPESVPGESSSVVRHAIQALDLAEVKSERTVKVSADVREETNIEVATTSRGSRYLR